MLESSHLKEMIKKGIAAVIILVAAFALGFISGESPAEGVAGTAEKSVEEGSEILRAVSGYGG